MGDPAPTPSRAPCRSRRRTALWVAAVVLGLPALLGAWLWATFVYVNLAVVVVTEVRIAEAELVLEGRVHPKPTRDDGFDRVFGWVGLEVRRYPPTLELRWTGPDGRRHVIADTVRTYPGDTECIFYVRLDAAGEAITRPTPAEPDNGLRTYCHPHRQPRPVP